MGNYISHTASTYVRKLHLTDAFGQNMGFSFYRAINDFVLLLYGAVIAQSV